MLKKKINQITFLFGFKVVRANDMVKNCFSKLKEPLIIEFIGVSGVGKSTLYDTLKKKKRNWYLIQEFKQSVNHVDLDEILEKSTIYQKLAAYRLVAIQKSKIKPSQKFRIAHWNYRSLLDDALIFNENKNAVIVSDEGLLHNFSDVIIELFYENPQLLQLHLKNRAVVYCFSSVEKIVSQIEKRSQETQRTVVHHRGKNPDEINLIVSKDLEEKEKFISILTDMKVPILRVSTQDSLEENLKKIEKFIQELQSNRLI